MNPIADLSGIVTVLNTPFTVDNKIDEQDLERHVNYAMESGVHGFLVPAMAAEVYKLDHKERQAMLTRVLKTVDGELPVVAGVYASDSSQQISLARDYIKSGASIILASIPFENENQFIKDASILASEGMDVLMLQDWSPNDYGIPISVIEHLAEEVPEFRSIKIEVGASGIKYSEVLERTNGKMHVAGGWAVTQMIEGLERGIHAFMPTGLHEVYVKIYRLFKAGKLDDARNLHQKLLPVLSFSNQHLDISIHFFKRLLFSQGVYKTPLVRSPILGFDKYHQNQADYLIKYATSLINEVKTGIWPE